MMLGARAALILTGAGASIALITMETSTRVGCSYLSEGVVLLIRAHGMQTAVVQSKTALIQLIWGAKHTKTIFTF